MLGFIKRISKEFNDYYTLKILFVSLVRPNLEYASSVWSPHKACHSERKHNFVRYALRMLHWTADPLPNYDSRCALLGLLEDRRTRAFDIGIISRFRYFDIEIFQFRDSDINSDISNIQFDDKIY
jgi:hypothetical protein